MKSCYINCMAMVSFIHSKVRFKGIFSKQKRSTKDIHKRIIHNIEHGLLHTEESFRNLVKSNRNQIVFTIFWLIKSQTDVRLFPNQSVHGKYNMISVWFNKIPKRFLCVHNQSIAHEARMYFSCLAINMMISYDDADIKSIWPQWRH